jgi:hypothetical protein
VSDALAYGQPQFFRQEINADISFMVTLNPEGGRLLVVLIWDLEHFWSC